MRSSHELQRRPASRIRVRSVAGAHAASAPARSNQHASARRRLRADVPEPLATARRRAAPVASCLPPSGTSRRRGRTARWRSHPRCAASAPDAALRTLTERSDGFQYLPVSAPPPHPGGRACCNTVPVAHRRRSTSTTCPRAAAAPLAVPCPPKTRSFRDIRTAAASCGDPSGQQRARSWCCRCPGKSRPWAGSGAVLPYELVVPPPPALLGRTNLVLQADTLSRAHAGAALEDDGDGRIIAARQEHGPLSRAADCRARPSPPSPGHDTRNASALSRPRGLIRGSGVAQPSSTASARIKCSVAAMSRRWKPRRDRTLALLPSCDVYVPCIHDGLVLKGR